MRPVLWPRRIYHCQKFGTLMYAETLNRTERYCRRTHSQLVFQAIQAVLAVVGAWELQAGCALHSRPMVRGIRLAGWVKP